MESEKPGFSEDGDHHRDLDKIEEPSSRRSYECVFCKRGFTNAQALGGHMNIHRKDRPKSSSSSSKHVLNPSVPNPNPSPVSVTRVTGPFPFEKSVVPDSWEALRSKLFPVLTHADATKYLNSNYPIIVHSSSSNFERTAPYEEKLGSDLTLQIGSSCPNTNEEVAGDSDEEREDIDLELRLGRGDP